MPVTRAITLQDITIYPVVEQQGPFFDVMEFFPTLTKDLLEEHRSWLQPTFIDPVSGRLVLCVQSFVVKTPHHNVLIDSCVGSHKPRPARPFWNMMNSDRFERASRLPASPWIASTMLCARTCMWTMWAGTLGLRTGAGCRRFPGRNTSWPPASSRTGHRRRRMIRQAFLGLRI